MDSYSEIKRFKMILESVGTESITQENSEIAEIDTGEMEEGNEFSGARAAAIKAGKDTFTVDGKTYHVTGEKEVDETESADWNTLAMEAGSDINSQWEQTETVAETDVEEQADGADTDPALQRLRELSGITF